MNEPKEIEVAVQFLGSDEFDARQWPEYDAPLAPGYTEDDFQKEYYRTIEALESTLTAEGWIRGFQKGNDFDILMDWARPHRSLGMGVGTDRILCPRFIPILNEFLAQQPKQWMINVSDERWAGSGGGFHIDFKLVAEAGTFTMAVFDQKILDMLGLERT